MCLFTAEIAFVYRGLGEINQLINCWKDFGSLLGGDSVLVLAAALSASMSMVMIIRRKRSIFKTNIDMCIASETPVKYPCSLSQSQNPLEAPLLIVQE